MKSIRETLSQGWYHLEKLFYARNAPWRQYCRKAVNNLVQAALLLLITTVCFLVLLYLCGMMWHTYQLTYVGQNFAVLYPDQALSISTLLRANLLHLAAGVTLSSFMICIAVSALFRFFHLTRYLYLPRGFFGKILMFGLPLAALVSAQLQDRYGYVSPDISYLISLIPTLALFPYCFRYTLELVPELGWIIRQAISLSQEAIACFPAFRKMNEGLIEKINS